jgi:hypothetical protein
MPARSRVLLAVVAVVALVGAGCGESKKDSFKKDYRPLNDELIGIGKDLATAIRGARQKTNAQLASEFGGIANHLDDLNGKLKDLDAPGDLKDDLNRLTSDLDDLSQSTEQIESAARTGDASAAGTATVQLITKARDVNQSQDALAEATGAKKGE